MTLKLFLKYLQYLLKSRSAHGVHSPFVFRFIHELIESKNEDYYQFKELNEVRNSLLKNNLVIEIEDFGAGSKIFKDNKRKISGIAKHGISKRKFSELYFKLMNFCKVKYCVELGTSLGLNTLYLAKANTKALICTVEGSPALADFACKLFKEQKAENIKLIRGNFKETLPAILDEIPHLDLFYVDGDHRYESTLAYFKMALSKKHNDSVFVFDDINWDENMQKAWEEIKQHPEVTLSLDLFYVGMVFFRKEQKEKEHFILKF